MVYGTSSFDFEGLNEPKKKIVFKIERAPSKYLSLLEPSLKNRNINLEIGLGTTSSIVRIEDSYYHRTEKYVSRLSFSNIPVSYIWVQRQVRFPINGSKCLADYLKEECCFWNDFDLKPFPVVTDQFTEENFRGYGLNTFLIAVANEHYSSVFGVPLYSHVDFADMKDTRNGKLEIKKGSRRVWEKLEEKGLAERIKWQDLDRWRCKVLF